MGFPERPLLWLPVWTPVPTKDHKCSDAKNNRNESLLYWHLQNGTVTNLHVLAKMSQYKMYYQYHSNIIEYWSTGQWWIQDLTYRVWTLSTGAEYKS